METQAMMDGHLRYKKKPLNLYSNIKAAMCELDILFIPPEPCFSMLLYPTLCEGNYMYCISLTDKSVALYLPIILAKGKY